MVKQSALRWWYILRYYRVSQLAMRLAAVGRRRLTRMAGGPHLVPLPEVFPKRRENTAFGSWLRWKLTSRSPPQRASNAQRILAGRYRLLNEERVLPDPLDWRLEHWPGSPHLWRFHLHCHAFLLDLAAQGVESGEQMWFKRAWQLVIDWIENNHPSDPRALTDAWHPYCISRRLPVWILLWSASPPGGELGDRVLSSMFSQAGFLEHHLEWDVRGNHLLENARALVLMGAFLDCPDAHRWLHSGAAILRHELPEQILPHGEHFERSPMYHALMLELVLDVRDVADTLLPDLGDLCHKTALKMADFLSKIVHPDGEIPLLGDACLGEAPPVSRLTTRTTSRAVDEAPGQIVAHAEGPHASLQGPHASLQGCGDLIEGCGDLIESPIVRTVGDYWIYRDRNDFVIFDAGPVGPDHLPAHAHADLLSFEASFRGRRLVVDSGVFNYRDDAMRRYCRSTAAHNALEIDGRDQCDMWSRFRMGYRGWPSPPEHGQTHGFYWARATHNAYRRLNVPRIGRWLACRPGGPWLCVDWAEGKGRHLLSSRLHFHPHVEVHKVADADVRLWIDGTTLILRHLLPGRVSVTTGWYCPEFGRRLPCPVVEWSREESLPSVCGWSLAGDECDGVAALEPTDSGSALLRWREREEETELRWHG